MKLDSGDLVPQLASIGHAKAHQEACRDSQKYLGNFLTWATHLNHWDFQKHLTWLRQHEKNSEFFPSYAFMLGQKMASFAGFGQGHDFLGKQIVYWTNQRYRGCGIGKEVTAFLMDKAFLQLGAQYLEIHVDKSNKASERIPESLGFQVVNSYECHPHGFSGTGEMNVWGTVNPKNEAGYSNETYPWKDVTYTESKWSMTEEAIKALYDSMTALKVLGSGKPAHV